MTRAATAILCVALAAAAPRAARASAADAFENKVRPVSGQLYTKAGKLELTVPALGLSLNDAFYSKWTAGGRLGYHFSESFSVAAVGLLARSSPTGSTQLCGANTGCRDADRAQLNQVPGELRWTAGLELGWAPIYGKLNLVGLLAPHFDLSLVVGADVVAYRDVVGLTSTQPAATRTTVAISPGAHVGVATRVFLGRSTALRLELRDVGYWVSHLKSGNLQTQLLAEVGLSFLLGGGSAP